MIVIRNLLVVFAILAPTTATAASGYVKGRLLFYQNQGNYCPNSRNCTGAQYTQSQFNVNFSVGDVKVYLKNEATGAVIGQSSTDPNGNYVISWSSSAFPIQGTIYWLAQHKDGRFSVQTSTGGSWLLWSSPFTLVNGTTTTTPQDRGSLVWGNSGAPNQIANVYNGAFRTWYSALKYSSRMVSNFSGLSIRAFSNTCTTSCASGSANLIHLDPNAAFAPQARVMHEMGHIASYKSNPFKSASNYCYPSQSCVSAGWNATSPEWKSGSFEEGMASFIGDVAIYWYYSPAPHNCFVMAAPCTTDLHNVETSPYSGGGSCVTNQERWELSTERFLWDIYDIAQENFFFTGDFDNRPYYEFFDMLASFPNGTGDHQDDEPWNSGRSALDAFDGRSGEDFDHWFSINAFDPFNQRVINCNP